PTGTPHGRRRTAGRCTRRPARTSAPAPAGRATCPTHASRSTAQAPPPLRTAAGKPQPPQPITAARLATGPRLLPRRPASGIVGTTPTTQGAHLADARPSPDGPPGPAARSQRALRAHSLRWSLPFLRNPYREAGRRYG